MNVSGCLLVHRYMDDVFAFHLFSPEVNSNIDKATYFIPAAYVKAEIQINLVKYLQSQINKMLLIIYHAQLISIYSYLFTILKNKAIISFEFLCTFYDTVLHKQVSLYTINHH